MTNPTRPEPEKLQTRPENPKKPRYAKNMYFHQKIHKEDFLKFSDVLFEQNNCLLTMIGQAMKIFRRFDGSIIFAFG